MTSSDPEEPPVGDQPGTPGGSPAGSPAGSSAGSPAGSPAGSSAGEPTPPAASAHRAQLPDDVDAAFAAIVAGWAADGAPRWPVEPVADPSDRARPDDDGPSSGLGTATPPAGHPAVGDTPAARPAPRVPPEPGDDPRAEPPPHPHRPHPAPDPEAEEHFVPPEPPPMPRLSLSSLAGIALLVVGVVLLAVPSLLGGSIALGIVPGLLAMTAGLGWLVFGLRRPQERDGDEPDDGAVL